MSGGFASPNDHPYCAFADTMIRRSPLGGLSVRGVRRYLVAQKMPERRLGGMGRDMRYGFFVGILIGLAGCMPGAGSDLSWLDEVDTGNTGPVPCYETVMLPSEAADAPPREERIKTLCPDQITPALVKNLQRALTARQIYDGPVNGVFGPLTKAAVETYQTSQGLPTPVLTLDTARELGLIAYPRPEGEVNTLPDSAPPDPAA